MDKNIGIDVTMCPIASHQPATITQMTLPIVDQAPPKSSQITFKIVRMTEFARYLAITTEITESGIRATFVWLAPLAPCTGGASNKQRT